MSTSLTDELTKLVMSSAFDSLVLLLSGLDLVSFIFTLLKSFDIDSNVIVDIADVGDAWLRFEDEEEGGLEISDETLFWGTLARSDGTGDKSMGHVVAVLLLELKLDEFAE